MARIRKSAEMSHKRTQGKIGSFVLVLKLHRHRTGENPMYRVRMRRKNMVQDNVVSMKGRMSGSEPEKIEPPPCMTVLGDTLLCHIHFEKNAIYR